MFALISQAMDSGALDRHLTEVRKTLDTRYNTLSAALDSFLPEGCSYEVASSLPMCL